jgi:hypothetical protein
MQHKLALAAQRYLNAAQVGERNLMQHKSAKAAQVSSSQGMRLNAGSMQHKFAQAAQRQHNVAQVSESSSTKAA